MDFTLLVEEITRLVCARLEAAEGQPGVFQVAAPAAPIRTQSVLVVMGQQWPVTATGFDYEAFAGGLQTLAKTAPVAFSIYPSTRYPCLNLAERLPPGTVRLLAGDPDWRTVAADHRALVIPNAGVAMLAKMATLYADESPVEAALQMLVLDRPVLAGWDDVASLLEHRNTTARGVLDAVRGHVRSVQSLGVHLATLTDLFPRLASVLGTAGTPSMAGSKAVVTQDDIRQLGQQGQKRAVYPAGSIVTSLAWEAAASLGVEIVVQ